MTKITIAIDGFSSTGKSTLAKELATALNYVYVDSGAMYRAVTLYAMRQGFLANDIVNSGAIADSLGDIDLSFVFNTDLGFAEMYLNGENIEHEIRTLEVSNKVSSVASLSPVRRKLVEDQQEMGAEKGVVMDGRDIGTVVFPDAELKIFMTASAVTRAQRRYDELKSKGDTVTFDAVLENVQQRDAMDTSREDSPLVRAEDALIYDNSEKSRNQQFQEVLQLAQTRIKEVNS
jgi:cytidylate kinase